MSNILLGKEKKFEWCILQVRSGTEAQILKIINKYYANDDLEEIFIPSIVNVSESDLGEKPESKKNNKFLQGYIFIKMNLQSNLLKQISSIPLVYSFLSQGEKPKIISAEEIQKIKDSIKDNVKLTSGNKMSVGNTVQVISGPFESYTGVIEEICEEKVKVKIIFCGRDVIVNFNAEQLKCTG
jgi:transcriptional antiterminator NusG